MSILLVGDLHLTTLPRDAYRWEVFTQLRSIIKKETPKHLVLLGDLTDEKDRHTAELVNRITDAIPFMQTPIAPGVDGPEVHVVRGNHDGIDPKWPYFHFLSRLSRVTFYPQPSHVLMFGKKVLVLPHSRDPLHDWQKVDFHCDYVFAHVTVKGATSESGVALRSALGSDYFRERNVRVLSGDVHVPQTLRPVTYVGAPYPIRFGDNFKPRVILLDGNKERSIDLHSIQRLMLDIHDADELDKVKCGKGDQAKVRLHLPSDRLSTWLKQRKAITDRCRKIGLQLVAVELVRERSKAEATMSTVQRSQVRSPQRVLDQFVMEKSISKERAAVGKALLEKAV